MHLEPPLAPGSSSPDMKTERSQVRLYSTRHCTYCRQAKGLLRKLGVRFIEYDVERNRRTFTEFQRAGGRGVPLILIGRERLNGFDAHEIKRMLRREGYDV